MAENKLTPQALWNSRNPQKLRQYRQTYMKTHREQENARQRALQARRRKSDPESVREYARAYRLSHLIECLVGHAKGRARERGLEFDGLADIAKSRPVECACCAVAFDYARKNGKPSDLSPSLDRLDSTQGYVSRNVRVICWRCNRLKKDASIEDLEVILAYMRSALPNCVPL